MIERQLSLLAGPRQRGVTVRSQASEFALHCAVVDTFRVSRNKGWRCIHIPNGGWRTKAEAAKFTRMGVHPGVPDLLLVGPGGKCCWLEIKTKYGRTTEAQDEFLGFLADIGATYAIAWSYEEAIDRMRDWGAVRVAI